MFNTIVPSIKIPTIYSINIFSELFRFDSETQNLMNDLRQEKAQRERLAREKEIAIAEKFTIEQNLSVSILI